jgi:hypothetical protein
MRQLMRAGEVGRALGVTRERVRQLTLAGHLLAVDTPLGRLYVREDVERLAKRRELVAASKGEIQ